MTGLLERMRPHRAEILARLIATALGLVLVGVAVFAFASHHRAVEAMHDAEQSMELARSYADARSGMTEAEVLAVRLMMHPDPSIVDEFDTLIERILADFEAIEQTGTDQDRALIASIRAEHLPDIELARRFFQSLLTRTPFTEPLPDPEVIAEIERALEAPVSEQQDAALVALRTLREASEVRLRLTIVVFGAGLGLSGVFLWLLERLRGEKVRSALAMEQFRAAALTDSLTGLANHRSFQEALASEAPSWERGLVMLIDIDRFKEVNDLEGHGRGDEVLQEVAAILDQNARAHNARAFRIGGDEFAILLETPCPGALTVGEQIRSQVDERVRGVTASVGYAQWTTAGGMDRVPAQADAALLWAKRQGRNRVVAFDAESIQMQAAFSAEKSRAVRAVSATGEGLGAAFQPIWSVDGQLVACEALARFAPELGLDGPEEAFAVAEQDGHALDLDRVTRAEILRHVGSLGSGTLLFLNVSPAALIDDGFSVPGLLAQVRAAGLDASGVVLEITERAAVPPMALQRRVGELRGAGFQIALDDVGAGNAGLEMLRYLRVDWVKIDRSIVASAPDEFVARGVLRAIMSFAAEAGATIVAEGIETQEMLGTIRSLAEPQASNVTRVTAQGYLLGRPQPSLQFNHPDALRSPAA